MRKFFKDNIWLFAIVAAILVIQGIFGLLQEEPSCRNEQTFRERERKRP